MRTFVYGICVAILSVLLTQHSTFAQSDCSVVGVTISKKKEGNKYGQGYVPGAMEGVRVYLKVPVGMNIISVAEENQPKIFDEKDKDLTGKRRSMSLRYLINYSEDRQTAIIPVTCSTLPPAGTKSLSVKGSFTFKCGTKTKEEVIEVELKTGAKCKMAGLDTEVRRIAKGFGKEDSTRITFRSNESFENIKAIYAIDANGKELEGRSAGFSSFGFKDKKTYDQSFELPGKQDSIKKIKIEYFHETEEKKVDVDVSFSLGF